MTPDMSESEKMSEPLSAAERRMRATIAKAKQNEDRTAADWAAHIDLLRKRIDQWINWIPFEQEKPQTGEAIEKQEKSGILTSWPSEAWSESALILNIEDLDITALNPLLTKVRDLGYVVRVGKNRLTIHDPGFEVV